MLQVKRSDLLRDRAELARARRVVDWRRRLDRRLGTTKAPGLMQFVACADPISVDHRRIGECGHGCRWTVRRRNGGHWFYWLMGRHYWRRPCQLTVRRLWVPRQVNGSNPDGGG